MLGSPPSSARDRGSIPGQETKGPQGAGRLGPLTATTEAPQQRPFVLQLGPDAAKEIHIFFKVLGQHIQHCQCSKPLCEAEIVVFLLWMRKQKLQRGLIVCPKSLSCRGPAPSSAHNTILSPPQSWTVTIPASCPWPPWVLAGTAG